MAEHECICKHCGTEPNNATAKNQDDSYFNRYKLHDNLIKYGKIMTDNEMRFGTTNLRIRTICKEITNKTYIDVMIDGEVIACKEIY